MEETELRRSILRENERKKKNIASVQIVPLPSFFFLFFPSVSRLIAQTLGLLETGIIDGNYGAIIIRRCFTIYPPLQHSITITFLFNIARQKLKYRVIFLHNRKQERRESFVCLGTMNNSEKKNIKRVSKFVFSKWIHFTLTSPLSYRETLPTRSIDVDLTFIADEQRSID